MQNRRNSMLDTILAGGEGSQQAIMAAACKSAGVRMPSLCGANAPDDNAIVINNDTVSLCLHVDIKVMILLHWLWLPVRVRVNTSVC